MSSFIQSLIQAQQTDSFGFLPPEELCLIKDLETSFQSGQYQVCRSQHLMPMEKTVGKLFLKAGLYSKGTDFSRNREKTLFPRVHFSHLMAIWKGEAFLAKQLPHVHSVTCWTLLHKQLPVGVVALTHGDQEISYEPEPVKVLSQLPKSVLPVLDLGGLSLFLKKSFREQGLMKEVLKQIVLPDLEATAELFHAQTQALPFWGSEDAAQHILQQLTPWPVVPFHAPSRKRSQAIWDWYQSHQQQLNVKTQPYQEKRKLKMK